MGNRRSFLMGLFACIIWLAVFFGVFAVPAVALFSMRPDVLLLVMTLILFYFYLMRWFIRPVVFMFLAHIVVPIAAWYFSPDAYHMFIYLPMAAALMCFSLYQRYNKSQGFSLEFTIFAPLILIVLALVVAHQGGVNMYFQYAIMIVIVCVGGRLHVRMAHIDYSLEAITQSSNQPVQRILAFDFKAMVVLTVVLIGLIAFFYVFLVRPAFGLASNFRPNFVFEQPTDDIDDFSPMFGGIQQGARMPMDLLGDEDYGPALIWRILEWLMYLILVPAIVLGLGLLLFLLIRKIYRGLQLGKDNNPEIADGFEDIKEFIKAPKAWGLWRRGPRNENKLRRLFRETVTRHIKKGVPINKSDTPTQMAGKIQAEDINALAEDYAAVRYGTPTS